VNWFKLVIFAVAVSIFCTSTVIALPAQTFNSYNLGGITYSPVVQGFDGNFYGTSASWGKKGGAVFKITPSGTVTALHAFCAQTACTDGSDLVGGLFLAPNGNFYGMTQTGGANNNSSICDNLGCGTIFEITPAGKVTTLYNFCAQTNCADGAYPSGGLVQGINGNLYGTTLFGGGPWCGAGHCEGTVFELTSTGQLNTLYRFDQCNCEDGSEPYSGLILARNGTFYGTTIGGHGTAFSITPTGTLTTIYRFCSLANCENGSNPYAGLIQGSDGYLYGATSSEGLHNNGTLFRLSLAAKLTVMHQFCSTNGSCPDGAQPTGALIQATDGNFYGTTQVGGATWAGTVFELSPTGAYTVLYNFCPTGYCTQGMLPQAQLFQATNGILYGTTLDGGGAICGETCGTVFSVATGLGAFVIPNPAFGKVGRAVNILGNGLTGTTGVKFSGIATSFAVVSDTRLTASVPSGATDGTIEVTTSTGMLSSNVSFHVIP
jgi:uncharacterized repeat protein (TIGR03803 family)